MITWREENLDGRIDAHLGDHRVGSVWTYGNRGEASWEVWLGKYGADGSCPTLPAAKEALERAVADWCRRANLVHLPEGHVVVSRELAPQIRVDGDGIGLCKIEGNTFVPSPPKRSET